MTSKPLISGLVGCFFITIVFLLSGCATSKSGESDPHLIFLGADGVLQQDATIMVMAYESVFGAECKKPKIAEKQITESPEKPGESVWVEMWTVDRCGKNYNYHITFTPTPSRGGTDIRVVTPPVADD